MSESRWQRFWKWLRKQPSTETKIKVFGRIAIIYAILGIVMFAFAFYIGHDLSQIYKNSEPLTSLPDLEWYQAISFLCLIYGMVGSLLLVGGFCWVLALYCQSDSLELRIRELEKKAEKGLQ